MNSQNIIIAGGGIGGLTAALCLHHHGFKVIVLEQSAQLKEAGAGIQISPNGIKVLRALGLEQTVQSIAFSPQKSEVRIGRTGRVLVDSDLQSYPRQYGAPYWHIHRADLIALLADALHQRAPGSIRTAACVAGYAESQSGIAVHLADGEVVHGDLLIGADGIHSAVRAQMLGPEKPHFTGNMAWRMTVPVDRLGRNAPPPNATIWLGKGRHAVTYLLRDGKLANCVAVVERADFSDESWVEKGDKRQALSDFAGWHPIITTIIDQADSHYRWALLDREPLERWHSQRVVLLGDACHAMLPFLAQGAVQAIEDAWILAQKLGRYSDLTKALQFYEQVRKPRTTRIQKAAWSNMDVFHKSSVIGRLAMHGPLWLAGKAMPDILDSQLGWLYGHDVTR